MNTSMCFCQGAVGSLDSSPMAAAPASKLKLASRFRIIVPAGKATPQPPVGSALGQRGLKLMDFCKAFNDQTSIYKEGTPIPVRVKAYVDRTFTFDTFTPHTSYFLKKAAGLEKGANRPGHETVGRVTVQQVYEIAKVRSSAPAAHLTRARAALVVCS